MAVVHGDKILNLKLSSPSLIFMHLIHEWSIILLGSLHQNHKTKISFQSFINFSNSETTQAELEPINDNELTFETLHQEIGKPIQENLQRSENSLTVI